MRSDSYGIDDRLHGGWPHRVINYYSWALSCLQLRKYYDEVELVTDHFGQEIFIDKIGLPYTSVRTVLNQIDHYSPALWALGKLYTYGLQDKPFLHVDGDVFIFQEFGEQLMNAALIGQNMELTPVSMPDYEEVWAGLVKIPSYFGNLSGVKYIPGVSAGILGGNDIIFFKEYVKEAFSFLENNMEVIVDSLLTINAGFVNVITEQVVFEALARRHQHKITCLFPQIDAPDHIGVFNFARDNKNYVHCYGFYKSVRICYAHLEWRLQTDYPEYYHKINRLIEKSEI
ncbi:hypothetical protein Q4E93_28560 [Flavitalea sp. BT771]|uniref:DUF6734 family protein n=1 Tax=Flavitalea sp. BT771 TaxID=3063329 RepID=UPI0026E3938D|nr:DUF6734 family protein [Flavitalea sp. BT771]MDO6434597.1 hypothetical protein [Flavitalea sp. BT771]MDV6223497.1 DUF6734 family protein [Flavitalea sp. BT771]